MTRTKNKSILKFLLKACGLAAVAVVAAVVGLLIWFSPGKTVKDSPYHPFRTEQAKKQFLAFYDAKAKKWPVPSKTMTVKTSYGLTFVRISGPPQAPPLVLLHGAGGNSLQWLPNIAALSQKYRVYAVDIINDYGRSVSLASLTAADDYVKWLHEALTALGLTEHVNLAGLSYGGWIAARFALQYPDALSKLVLLAPAGTVLPLPLGWIVRAIPCALPCRCFPSHLLYWLLADLARQGEAGRARVEEIVDESYLAITSFKPRNLVNPAVFTDAEMQRLDRVPALFLVGEHEKIYPAAAASARLHKLAPHIQTKLIPGAGHDLALVQPDLVDQAIIDFLDQPAAAK